jgi:hypothetical protein
VPKAEIAGNDYDLSINRYKEVEYEAVECEPPQAILKRLANAGGGNSSGPGNPQGSGRTLLDCQSFESKTLGLKAQDLSTGLIVLKTGL